MLTSYVILQGFVVPTFTLFEAACSQQTTRAVPAMSRIILIDLQPDEKLTCVRIIGTIAKLGSKVAGGFKEGQVVGVGSQIGCEPFSSLSGRFELRSLPKPAANVTAAPRASRTTAPR